MKASLKGFLLPFMAVVVLVTGCVTSHHEPSAVHEGSGVRGLVFLRSTGQPVEGAHVYAYRDSGKNLIGVADHVSRGTARDGSFTLELEPGEYYFVSRKRVSGANFGPVLTGDLYDHQFQAKPVRITAGRYAHLEFELEKMTEPMFFQVFTEAGRRTDTGIRGRLLDEEDVPVQGAFATAYGSSNMRRLPDFVSTVTGDDGYFVLYLPEGGRWYVGARSRARGVPRPGEPVGKYEGSKDNSIHVPEGSFLDGVVITLRPFTSRPPAAYKPY